MEISDVFPSSLVVFSVLHLVMLDLVILLFLYLSLPFTLTDYEGGDSSMTETENVFGIQFTHKCNQFPHKFNQPGGKIQYNLLKLNQRGVCVNNITNIQTTSHSLFIEDLIDQWPIMCTVPTDHQTQEPITHKNRARNVQSGPGDSVTR